jgi:hypothetical protein
MPKNSDVSIVSRRNFLAAAGSAVAASSFALGKDGGAFKNATPAPPVNYLVTIDVTGGSISYSAVIKDTVPPTPVSLSNNRDLSVESKDTVEWQTKTNKTANNPVPVHRLTILFLPNETPFIDGSGNPIYVFEGSQDDEAKHKIMGTIGPNSSSQCEDYECYVAVIDDAKGGKTYTDDPKIIVGNAIMDTTKGRLINEAQSDLEEAARLNAALRKRIESVERKLNNLKKSR